MRPSTHLLSSAVAALAVLAVVASPAAARINHPVGTVVTASSTNPRFTYGSSTTRCTRADFNGTVTADTNISGNLTFGGTCTTAGIFSTFTCTGTVTLEITRSPPDTRSVAEGVITLDGNYQCSIRPNVGACDITIVGFQPRLPRISYDNRQVLALNVGAVAATAAGGGVCGPASGNGILAASFTVTAPRAFSVSP